MPFAHKDVLKIRQSWVVCCYERQNFFRTVSPLLNCRLPFTEFDFGRYSFCQTVEVVSYVEVCSELGDILNERFR